jgi:hypothetical protein
MSVQLTKLVEPSLEYGVLSQPERSSDGVFRAEDQPRPSIPEHDDEGLSAASQSLIMMGADSDVDDN